MLREFLSKTDLFDLPLIAMGIFLAIFVTVLLRASQRSRTPEYRRLADLPLADDSRGKQP
jgi:hypothetical protein